MQFLNRLFNHDKPANQKKLLHLEKKIAEIETVLKNDKQELLQKIHGITTEKGKEKDKEEPPTFKIEHLQIDKIVIEKLDYANNFGQLGIKELSGKLNIGTSYEGDFAKEVEEKLKEKFGPQAKINLRAKKEK
jgi:hypothetical protein